VMEGRDIGTKVFPDAEVKIFLDAQPEVRAERRVLQQHAKGEASERVAAELYERDRRDATRAISPLVPAPDAVVLDSSRMSVDEVIAAVERIVQQKLAARSSRT